MCKMKIAILGSGHIGTDLLVKVMRSPSLECGLFAGRHASSAGMLKAQGLGVPVSDRGILGILANPACCELVFDATSAADHFTHWETCQTLGKRIVDLTPANLGQPCVPAVNLRECLDAGNVSLVTCGGQATIPLAYAIGQLHPQDLAYVEVASSIASRSAGPATRINLDEYVATTESGLRLFSGAARSKVILNLNPAEPCIDMQTTLSAIVRRPDIDRLTPAINAMVAAVRRYVPGYCLLVPPRIETNRIVMTVKVRGQGDHLPSYAGNLDVMTCAAVAVAEAIAGRIHADS